jgi:hypothetical protein
MKWLFFDNKMKVLSITSLNNELLEMKQIEEDLKELADCFIDMAETVQMGVRIFREISLFRARICKW